MPKRQRFETNARSDRRRPIPRHKGRLRVKYCGHQTTKQHCRVSLSQQSLSGTKNEDKFLSLDRSSNNETHVNPLRLPCKGRRKPPSHLKGLNSTRRHKSQQNIKTEAISDQQPTKPASTGPKQAESLPNRAKLQNKPAENPLKAKPTPEEDESTT